MERKRTKGERYWLVNTKCAPLIVNSRLDVGSEYDDEMWDCGNYFTCRKDADDAAEQISDVFHRFAGQEPEPETPAKMPADGKYDRFLEKLLELKDRYAPAHGDELEQLAENYADDVGMEHESNDYGYIGSKYGYFKGYTDGVSEITELLDLMIDKLKNAEI